MKHRITLNLVAGLMGAFFSTVLMSAETMYKGEKGVISVVTESSRIGEPRSVHVERRNNRLLVTGMIKKRFRNGTASMGHVDLEFLDADGAVVVIKKVDTFPTRWRRNQRWQRFSSIVGDIPKETRSVRVKYTSSLHDGHGAY